MTSAMSEDSIMRELNFTDDMYDFITMDTDKPIPCIDAFHTIGHGYRKVHGYIALIVCIFGTVANSVNLLILTHKDMRTPINLILSALALVDVLVMIEYIPFALHMYVLPATTDSSPAFTYPWAIFVLFHSHFTQILHTIGIQLTLTMAIWRYVAIRFTNQYQVNAYCTFRRCYMAIGASFVAPLFICIPNYLTFSIVRRRAWAFRPSASLPAVLRHKEAWRPETLISFCSLLWPRDSSCTSRIVAKDDYVVDLSSLAKERGGLLHIVHFWTYSVIVKLLPCVVLTFFMVYLLHTLYTAKQRHQVLQLSSAMPVTPVRCHVTGPRSCDQVVPKSRDRLSPSSSKHLLVPRSRDLLNASSSLHVTPSSTREPLPQANSNDLVLLESRDPTSQSALSPPTGPELNHVVSQRSPSDDHVISPNSDRDHLIASGSRDDISSQKACDHLKPNGRLTPPLTRLTVYDKSRSCLTLSTVNESSKALSISRKWFWRKTSSPQEEHFKKASRRSDRTSRMLVAVLCLFVLTELPQGVMAFLSGLYGAEFFRRCYTAFAEIWDLLALVNSSVNFILYCFMSRQFRVHFRNFFASKCCPKEKELQTLENGQQKHTVHTTLL